MPSIKIDEKSKHIIISGELGEPRRSFVIKDALKREFSAVEERGEFVIAYDSEEGLKIIINEVIDIFKRRELPLETSPEVNERFDRILNDKRRFEEFSKKALDIRNNNPDVDEFKDFGLHLASDMISRSLYPLQLLSAYHMAFSQNSCNFSVPGAGKTSIVYGAYSYLRSSKDLDRKVERIVIIGPLSSFAPWEKEFKECFGREPSVKRIMGSVPKDERIRYMYSRLPEELTLISYHSLSSFKEEDLMAFFDRKEGVMVVLDEAHRIKNPEGIHANAVMRISQYCKSRIVLTGTPAPNGYEDLYNLFKFIWPYSNIIGFELGHLKSLSEEPSETAVQTLINNLKPYFIRIRKSDLRLPPPTIHAIRVPMGNVQKRIYDFIELKCMNTMNRASNGRSSLKEKLASARLIRMIQAASNPSMLLKPLSEEGYLKDVSEEELFEDQIIFDLIRDYDSLETPSKFEEALRIIKEKIGLGEKVIVWASFINTINKFKEYLDESGIDSKMLYGSTPVESDVDDDDNDCGDFITRERIIDAFHDPNSPFKVIIANPQAVGESISLHKACNNAIYLERNFNAAQLIQSKDRIHRYGLEPGTITNYYYLISEQSIDETINVRLNVKEGRMNDIIEREEIPLFSVLNEDHDSDDIRALIDDYIRRTKKA